MATTKPSNLSERSNGTPHGRRTPRSSPGPRERNMPEKLVATHVKSPSSSRSDTATRTIRSTPSPSSTMSAATKKPPSSSSQPQSQRSPMPSTLKDRPLRAPSSLPKSASFSRTTQDKTSKTLRTSTSSRSLPSTKAKTPGISPSTVMRAKVSKAAQEEIKSHDQPKSIINSNVVDEDITVARAPDEENHEHVETPVIEDHHGLEELSVSSEPPPELHHEELAQEDELEIIQEEKEHDQEDEQDHKEDRIKEDEQVKKAGDDQGGTEEKHGEVDVEQKSESVQVKKPAEMPDRRKEVAPDGNAVIEKTASRLASRKNRVLALVGAFETVISLQEPEGAQQGQYAAAKEEEDNNNTLQSSQSV